MRNKPQKTYTWLRSVVRHLNHFFELLRLWWIFVGFTFGSLRFLVRLFFLLELLIRPFFLVLSLFFLELLVRSFFPVEFLPRLLLRPALESACSSVDFLQSCVNLFTCSFFAFELLKKWLLVGIGCFL